MSGTGTAEWCCTADNNKHDTAARVHFSERRLQGHGGTSIDARRCLRANQRNTKGTLAKRSGSGFDFLPPPGRPGLPCGRPWPSQSLMGCLAATPLATCPAIDASEPRDASRIPRGALPALAGVETLRVRDRTSACICSVCIWRDRIPIASLCCRRLRLGHQLRLPLA